MMHDIGTGIGTGTPEKLTHSTMTIHSTEQHYIGHIDARSGTLDNLSIEGDEGLRVESSITVGSGEITNDDGDYSITEDGIKVFGDGSTNLQGAYRLYSTEATDESGHVGLLVATGVGSTRRVTLASVNGFGLQVVAGSGDMILSADGSIEIQDLPTTEQGGNDLWKNGNMLGIGGAPVPMLLPRMTTTQLNNYSSPVNGMVAFNTTTQQIWLYRSGNWTSI